MSDDSFIYAEIDPRDYAEFVIALDHLYPKSLMRGEWPPFLRGIYAEVGQYPKELPNQKYIRTGNLRRNWRYAVLNDEKAQIENLATYAGWVQGVGQAAIHEGRWKRAIDVAEEKLEALVKRLAQKVDNVWIK